MTLRLRLWGRGAVFFTTMEIVRRRPRLTAMSLLGMGLVFEGIEGQWTFQAWDNRVL
jgi:hypothetical protein